MARMEASTRETGELTAQAGQRDASLFEMGLHACSGRDGSIDLIQAHKWFNLAAMQGNEDAKRYRLDIARDMTKLEIACAQKLAREWLATKH